MFCPSLSLCFFYSHDQFLYKNNCYVLSLNFNKSSNTISILVYLILMLVWTPYYYCHTIISLLERRCFYIQRTNCIIIIILRIFCNCNLDNRKLIHFKLHLFGLDRTKFYFFKMSFKSNQTVKILMFKSNKFLYHSWYSQLHRKHSYQLVPF